MQTQTNTSFQPTRGVRHVNVKSMPQRRHMVRFNDIRPVVLPQRLVRWVKIADIVKRLEVTTLAVNKWREGSTVRPSLASTTTQVGKSNRVAIKESDLVGWLELHRPDLLIKWREN